MLALDVLHSYEKTLGEDDEKILHIKRSLRIIYNITDPSKAESINKQILETIKRTLGPDHPSTFQVMNALASTYATLDRLEEAKELLVRVVQGYREVDTSELDLSELYAAIGDLEGIYEDQERWDEAEPLAVEVANGWQELAESSGNEHLIEALRAVERIYTAQNRSEDAQKVMTWVCTSHEQVPALRELGADICV